MAPGRSRATSLGAESLTLILDAGVLYAQADRNDPFHGAVVALLRSERGALVTSEIVLAEADYLILSRLGVDVELAFLRDIADGTFLSECLTASDLQSAHAIATQYRDLRLGLADVSLVLLAARHRTRRVASLDERAFRVITPLQGGSFTVLPADE